MATPRSPSPVDDRSDADTTSDYGSDDGLTSKTAPSTVTWVGRAASSVVSLGDAQQLALDLEALPRPGKRRKAQSIVGLCCGVCMAILAIILVINLLLFTGTAMYADPPIPPSEYIRAAMPIPCHSHNDYWRKAPVFSALHVGCVGIEADVWLTDDDLFVGHDWRSLKPNRTFHNMYIEPLVRILEQQNGQNDTLPGPPRGIYDMDPSQTLVLLVDLKTDAVTTWPWVIRQLEPLRQRGWLSYVDESSAVHYGPITVVGTGYTTLDLVMRDSNATHRDVFLDAPLGELEGSPYNATNSYYTSVSFKSSIGVVPYWGFSDGQLATLRAQVKAAHERNLKVRYWDLPSFPKSIRNFVWATLRQEGVDILNVDELKDARDFLNGNGISGRS